MIKCVHEICEKLYFYIFSTLCIQRLKSKVPTENEFLIYNTSLIDVKIIQSSLTFFFFCFPIDFVYNVLLLSIWKYV